MEDNKDLRDAKRNHLMFIASLLITGGGFLTLNLLAITTEGTLVLMWCFYGISVIGCVMLFYTTYVYTKNYKIWNDVLC